jgi:two-component system phosphate regulon sensor histidine kinase PhoR
VQEIVADASKDRVLQVSATPMEQGARGGAGFVLVFRDVSETKRLERARRDFVANVSHELRTPLAAIRGYSETLLAGALRDPERAGRFLSIIERHAERLGRLVDDLLTLSDLELGRKELTYEPTPPEQVIETACELLREKAVEKGVTLSSSLDEGTPALYVDADQVVQVLVNLIENAVKYTPAAGRVSVTATRAVLPGSLPDRPAKDTWVQITVADTGIGIPADQLPRLTERFYRVDKARSRELGGTGLGLAIVKHIVQAHGGWLRIDSELNKGTTIQVVLPGVSPVKA